MMEIEKVHPGSFSQEKLVANQEVIEKLKTINTEEIDSKIEYFNNEFIRIYQSEYRNLLKEIGSTFEMLEIETKQEADRLLNFRRESKIKFANKKSKKDN